ncbi:hypothetical protein [Nonomuraea sp. NPDC001699]
MAGDVPGWSGAVGVMVEQGQDLLCLRRSAGSMDDRLKVER